MWPGYVERECRLTTLAHSETEILTGKVVTCANEVAQVKRRFIDARTCRCDVSGAWRKADAISTRRDPVEGGLWVATGATGHVTAIGLNYGVDVEEGGRFAAEVGGGELEEAPTAQKLQKKAAKSV